MLPGFHDLEEGNKFDFMFQIFTDYSYYSSFRTITTGLTLVVDQCKNAILDRKTNKQSYFLEEIFYLLL